MEAIERAKQLEQAWKQGNITATEYHRILDFQINCLAADEMKEFITRRRYV